MSEISPKIASCTDADKLNNLNLLLNKRIQYLYLKYNTMISLYVCVVMAGETNSVDIHLLGIMKLIKWETKNWLLKMFFVLGV